MPFYSALPSVVSTPGDRGRWAAAPESVTAPEKGETTRMVAVPVSALGLAGAGGLGFGRGALFDPGAASFDNPHSPRSKGTSAVTTYSREQSGGGSRLSEQKHKEVRRERRRYHETFRGMVVEGQQARVFRDDISADLCVEYFFGSVHHLPTWWKPRGRLSAQEVGRSFADLFIAGLTPP